MTEVTVTFDDKEYFAFSSVSGKHTTTRNLVLKEVTLSAIAMQEPFKDFIVEMNKKGRMLATFRVENKIFLENYVNQDSFSYRDSSSNGTEITITITDRFVALKESDIILSKPEGSLQAFISSILSELDFAKPAYINRYQRFIKKSSDLLVNGRGVITQSLKTFQRSDLVEKDAFTLLGEACTLSNVLLVSNGFDTLTIEKPNFYPLPVFKVFRKGVSSLVDTNVMYAEKTNDTSGRVTPSKKILLNSNDKKDANTAVVVYYQSGLPHIHKVKHLSVKASYQDIANSLDFNFAGIKARANSFIYKIPHTVFDLNSDFFAPNRSVYVYDEKYGIDEVMTILQTGFTISANGGSEVTLNLTTQKAFDDNASIKQKRSLMKK